ncbi:DUF3052 domain-containing protein [Robiginitalea sp. SC105]|uniref:DUF3052 domain-containing protein n=1 Tax=Robiginitalea sp. SC105 TaxID=2762332 RepID=UPI001639FD97|nr:DUF3052 domain-containing protein [Robiginitalea sp. SC105]MBC2839543.1 DUF3052 domain-containing protein [Robiginitalea sp. SC105]
MALDKSGYSGTPLARKLGLKDGMRILVLNPPGPYHSFFRELPDLRISTSPGPGKIDFIHLFAQTFAGLESGLEVSVPVLEKSGMLWISWPKKASGLASEIDKFDVLRAGQAAGLVDVKVASVDAIWSGHKFVIPIKNR